MTKPELIEKLKSLEEESPCNWNAALSAAIYYIDKLEPTISELKKYCEKHIKNDCESCGFVDLDCDSGYYNKAQWDIKEMTKILRRD